MEETASGMRTVIKQKPQVQHRHNIALSINHLSAKMNETMVDVVKAVNHLKTRPLKHDSPQNFVKT